VSERDEWVGLWRLVWVTGARTKEALMEAIGKALDVVDNRDARSFFTHWSYSGLEQDFERRCRDFTGQPLAQGGS
jgi:hypothetical protein